MHWKRWVAVVLVLASAWGGYLWLKPGDARLMRRTLEQAAAACSWSAGAGALQKLSGANRLAALCTAEVEVVLELRGTRALQGADAVREAALAARGLQQSLRVELTQCEVTVGPEPGRGVVQALVNVHLAGESEPWLHELKVDMEKRDGVWLIARVEPVRGFGG